MTINNFDNCLDTMSVPDWYRAERFDYCDSFFEEKRRPYILSLVDTILTFITK